MTFDGGAKPQDCDERGKGVKTDRIDALALCQRLDRYTRGNLKAFSIVRVPTEDEERQRAFTRQRGQIVRERQRLQSMGRSPLASHGIHVTGKWWKGKTWRAIQPAWCQPAWCQAQSEPKFHLPKSSAAAKSWKFC
jgi:transposase